ncbi:unnamed protein product [Brachionus calyciflorus]|uniref:ATP-dependent DNA helicase n=1 Tax=Brachionus calyciflorus TaxID=104777 RepID=A0A814HA01_9BILA|nr:unnamed protein product [Brachionus calyciflorus]
MLSQASIAIIDKRLREATGKHVEYFGGISIILTGDPGQLLLVLGSPLYHFPPKDQLCTHGYDCYKQFDKAMQQNDDNNLDQKKFINLLDRLRNGDRIKKGLNSCGKYRRVDCIPAAGKNLNEENFFGLTNTINISINSKITLTNNLWTSKRLVNEANWTIRDIIYPNKENYRNQLPSLLLIEFDHYVGPRFFDKDDPRHNWIPINSLDAIHQILNYSRT